MTTLGNGSEPGHRAARQVLSELDVATLAVRILDPTRARPIVVVTSGLRAPADRLDADRIATALGSDVEVVALATGSLTYALERGLPAETHVFGDAARTYPVGAAWHERPHLSALRFCRADSDPRRLEAQVIADARAAARQASQAPPPSRPPRSLLGNQARPATKNVARPVITPAMLPGAPAPRPAARGRQSQPPLTAGAAPTPAPGPGAGRPQATAPASGPTPTKPRGAPTRPIRATPAPIPAETNQRTPVTGSSPAGTSRGRLTRPQPWHARSAEDGRTLADHLTSQRDHPVVVVTTPREDAAPLVDADDLHGRVHQIADVVVLYNGPASWALAEAMPSMTQVYGGAGRVYPTDLGWLTNPYRAPIRFCWPGDEPRQVADQLEDDAFGEANLAGLLTTGSSVASLPVTGKVKGVLDRHHVALWLDRGGDSVLLVDRLHPGVAPERLLRPGQALTGRVERGLMFPPFIPDAIDDDPHARAAEAYSSGDVVLARITNVAARSGRALLHPKVGIDILAGEDEPDLRNLIAVDDVVALTLLAADDGTFTAELADANAPSVPAIPVLPGGPPWLLEEDLPSPAPEPEHEPESELELEPEPPTAAPVPVLRPPAASSVAQLTEAMVGQYTQIAALTAQKNSLTALLDRERQESQRQKRAASQAREEAQRLRRENRSLKDQHRAYRDRVEGSALFRDPEEQLRYEIGQTWLRRTPEPERPEWPLHTCQLGLGFIDSLDDLEGIGRDKVLDVLVDVLTDRAKDIPGRELHPLRESESSPVQRSRADGARGWRCAMQVSTPSARRLHFWRLADGSIELDRVGTHDEGF